MKKIRVIEIIAGFSIEHPLGGIERFVIEMTQCFNQAEFDITVAGLWIFENEYRQKWIDQLNDNGITTVEFYNWVSKKPYLSFINSFRMLSTYLSTHPVNVYHSHDQFGDLMGILLKLRFKKLKLVRTVQNNFEWAKRPFRKLIFTNGLFPHFYDVEIGVNNKIIDDLNSRFFSKFINKNAVKIPNASNIANFIGLEIDVNCKKLSLGIGLNRLIIGSVGRLHEQKGYDVLLKAFQTILKSHPDAFLVILGDGPLFGVLNKQAMALGIQESVIFLGSRGDVAEVLKTFDVFVSSSRWEGLPGVVLESMAAGIPVVATDIPGTNEIIENKINGLLVKPGNSEKLAEGILVLLSDREVREKYAAAAITKLSEYDVQNIAKAYENVYRGILEKPE